MAVTQNIGRFGVVPLGPGMRIVATPSNGASANVDPVLIDPAELAGTDGVDGTDGAPGAPGPAGSSLIYGSGVPSNAVGIDGDSYVNTDTGDLYWKDAGAYAFEMNIMGPSGPAGNTGPAGGGLVPDQYTNSTTNPFNEAYIAAVVAADVTVNILIDDEGDQRSNNTLPAPLSGDMNRHLVRYDATANVWNDIGPFVGIKGETGDPGAPGAPGTPGNNGTNGAPGTPGTNGTNGTNGTDGDDGASAYDIAVANGFVGSEAAWLLSLHGSDGENAMPNEVTALTEAKITAIQTAGVDWLIVASPDNRVNKTVPAAINGDQSRNLLKYKASTTTWSVVGRWQGNDGAQGASGTGLDGVEVFRSAGVVQGGYYYEMRAAKAKTYTKVFAKQFAGTGDFDFELFVNGVSVYVRADVPFGTPFSASGLNISLPLNAEAYILITPSGASVTGVWVQFEE